MQDCIGVYVHPSMTSPRSTSAMPAMPGQQNKTANSWGRRKARYTTSERTGERLMPPSGAESVARLYRARMRLRAHYVRHRYSVSRPLLPLRARLLPPTFTIAHLPPPLLPGVCQHQIRSPSPSLPPLQVRSPPSHTSPPLHPLQQSRALRSLAPRPHRVYVPHSPYLYMLRVYASMYNYIPPIDVFTPSSLHFHGK